MARSPFAPVSRSASLADRRALLVSLVWAAAAAHDVRAAAVAAPTDELCTSSGPPARAVPRPVPVVLPQLSLRAADGSTHALARLMDERHAVLLNFVFTSCTTVCPPMAQVFAATQERLGPRIHSVRMVSISIDPEHDTPRRLQAYGARFGAGPQWRFLTGPVGAVEKVQRAFNVWQPDKMSHAPVTFWKPAGSANWWRLDGLASSEQLARLVTDNVGP